MLFAKAMGGFAFLMFSMGLSLFLPAGTLGFWKAWVYLAVFAACTILITVYLAEYDPALLAGRVKVGPTAEPERSQQIIQGLAGIFFLGLYVVSGLDFRFRWLSVPPPITVVSDAFVILGFLIVFLVFRENRYTRATVEVSQEQTVITTGPYRVVRHPMYAGAILMLIFTPPALGSWIALACLAPLVAVIIIRLLDEERLLETELAGYRAYERQVRYRLIPHLW